MLDLVSTHMCQESSQSLDLTDSPDIGSMLFSWELITIRFAKILCTKTSFVLLGVVGSGSQGKVPFGAL